MKRTLLTDQILDEVISFGGCAVTRRTAIAIMKEDGVDHGAIDYFAFKPRGLDMSADQAFTIEKYRQYAGGDARGAEYIEVGYRECCQ